MSPRAPTSVSNLQQPPTPIDHLLDKNTPAPTPTDQHDNKSITASPYVHPAPSVEPPPSVEGMHNTIGGGGGNMGPGSVPPPASVGRCTPTPQQQQQQQQCGSISVKKFELQPVSALTPLNNANPAAAAGLHMSGTTSHTNNPIDIKLEPNANTNSMMGGVVNNPNCIMNSSVLPNNNRNDTPITNTVQDYYNLYKPPKINVKDIDTFANEDCLKLDVLYDFTVQEAW